MILKRQADGAKKQPVLSSSLRTQKPDKPPAFSSTPWHPPSSHCKPSQPASSIRTAPISPMLKGTSHPGANSWPRPQPHPPRPAASQPLVKELWLGLGHLPCNAGATGIEMAMPLRPHAWRLPSKTVQKPEAPAVQPGAGREKKKTPRCGVIETFYLGSGYDISTLWSHQWLVFAAGHQTM